MPRRKNPKTIRNLDAFYPCCGGPAKFSREDNESNVMFRRCPRDGTRWRIERERGTVFGNSRIDVLHWEKEEK